MNTKYANTIARHPLTRCTALVLTALLATTSAQAAGKPAHLTPQQRYQQEAAACMRLGQADNRSNCLSEASTQLAQTQPTPASEAPAALSENALKRCEPLPDGLRQDCELRMRGAGTVSGSVEGGGIYRELVTRYIDTDAATDNTSTSNQ
ncbi:hypothetical protein BurJ1DRAFT_1095 [Burkholderiales bacterium JOSHI_001]|nr:hypothetical protein BurJ1DRAFT_1095 [Burkholderiales bacterium JOSHI_001]